MALQSWLSRHSSILSLSCAAWDASGSTGSMTSPKPSSSGPMWPTVAGKVNSADKLYLVVRSVRPDTKHRRDSTACSIDRNTHVPVDGAEVLRALTLRPRIRSPRRQLHRRRPAYPCAPNVETGVPADVTTGGNAALYPGANKGEGWCRRVLYSAPLLAACGNRWRLPGCSTRISETSVLSG
jgi:hypothetical protein